MLAAVPVSPRVGGEGSGLAGAGSPDAVALLEPLRRGAGERPGSMPAASAAPPGPLQQQPSCWVSMAVASGARPHPDVEPGQRPVTRRPALTGSRGPWATGLGMAQRVQVRSPGRRGRRASRPTPLASRSTGRTGDPAGEPAAHPHHSHLFEPPSLPWPAAGRATWSLGSPAWSGRPAQPGWGSRDDGVRQPQPGGRVEPTRELDRGQRVDAQVFEGAAWIDRVGRGVSEHRGDMRQDQVQQDRVPVGRRPPGEPPEQRARSGDRSRVDRGEGRRRGERRLAGRRGRGHPEPLVLEGVGGQVDPRLPGRTAAQSTGTP